MAINKTTLHDSLEKVSVNADSITWKELIHSKKKLLDIDRLNDDNETRHHLTYWILGFNALWMIGVMTVVILKGAAILHHTQTEIIALLTTTSANVLGFGYIVANYIYKQPLKKRKTMKLQT